MCLVSNQKLVYFAVLDRWRVRTYDIRKIREDVVSGDDVVNEVTYENSVDTDRHVKHTKYKCKTGHWCKVWMIGQTQDVQLDWTFQIKYVKILWTFLVKGIR